MFSENVLEKNPPKQGLKHPCGGVASEPNSSFREKSTKTRIETYVSFDNENGKFEVLEKNPPKQGLKHQFLESIKGKSQCFREKSTKTRIETMVIAVLEIELETF